MRWQSVQCVSQVLQSVVNRMGLLAQVFLGGAAKAERWQRHVQCVCNLLLLTTQESLSRLSAIGQGRLFAFRKRRRKGGENQRNRGLQSIPIYILSGDFADGSKA